MSFRCRRRQGVLSAVRLRRGAIGALLLMSAVFGLSTQTGEANAGERVLRVGADPNNLPFTNDRLEGFENKIAELIAEEMGAHLEYFWWPQRRGFFRNTLKEGNADIVMGVPSRFEMALPTKPYYRSTYVFAFREDSRWDFDSLDDPVLREVKIGVQMIGDDFMNAPPGHALASRGIINNVRGYLVYGDYSEESPPSDIIRAVGSGDIDVAMAWGPLAGYYAKRHLVPIKIVPLPASNNPALPFVFDISLGVGRGNHALKQELEEILGRRKRDIDQILDDYGIPRVTGTETTGDDDVLRP